MDVNKVYTTREAAKLWGYSAYTITKYCQRGKFEDQARQIGENRTWLITHEGMVKVTGREPGQKKGE